MILATARVRVAVRGGMAVACLMALLVGGCASDPAHASRFLWVPTTDLPALGSANENSQAAPGAAVAADSAQGRDSAQVRAEPLADWLEGPAATIATEEEREQFRKLRDESQRRTFVAAFWRRRDPDPGDGINEYRQEFERRVATADALFSSGQTRGSKTVFGIALLVFGYPYSVEAHVRKAGTAEIRDDAMAVPVNAHSRDQVLWRYLPEAMLGAAVPDSEPTSSSMVAASGEAAAASATQTPGPVQSVQFTYYAGAWRMSCGDVALARSWWASGVSLWTGAGQCYGGCGREVNLSSPDVPGSGTSTMGPLLTHGGTGGVTTPPIIDGTCVVFIDGYIRGATSTIY